MKMVLNYTNNKIFKIFILSHVFAYFSLTLIPAKAQVSNISFLILINCLFLILVSVSSLLVYLIYPGRNIKKTINAKSMSIRQLFFNVKIVSYGSVFGFLLVMYDRVVLRGIDYTKGLRLARYQWLSSTGGSLPSIIGNLLIPLGYLCIFFLIIHRESLPKRYTRLLLMAAVISIIGHSALNGGRSNLLIALVFALISFILKKNSLKKMFLMINPKIVKTLPIIVIAIGYVSIITFSSASMGNLDMKSLAYLGIQSLYGQVTKGFENLSIFGEVGYLIAYLIAYLYHGQWTAQIAYSLSIRDGNYTFYSFSVILNQLGILDQPLKQGYFSETGAFISLPGAFYYDFGYFGLIILSLLVGILFGIALIIINHNKYISGIKLSFIYYILFILFMSPILPAYGLIYTNFVVFAFVALDVVNNFKFRNKVNWVLEIVK